MANTEISIIVPIYNVEKYINKCIDSIIAQTYTDIEIILVDDGSPDKCPQICDDYAAKDPRIKVIHKTNGGLSDARNTGIEAACGRYIGFVDGDDCIKPDMYERLYNALISADADIAAANFIYVDEKYTPIEDKNKSMPMKDEVISGRTAFERTLEDKGWYYVTIWNKLYKKEIFEDIRFPVGKIHEDEFVAHRIYAGTAKAACIEYSGYMYVQRGGSIMGEQYGIKNLDGIRALEERFDYCVQKGMISYSVKLIQRIYGALLDAYLNLDMKDKENYAAYGEVKRKYLAQCRKIKGLLGLREWIIDVIIFDMMPVINKTAAVLSGRNKRT